MRLYTQTPPRTCRTPTNPGKLRPDVAGVILDACLAAPTPARWVDYERCKRQLSRLVGPDAPRDRQDRRQFELGMNEILGVLKL